jgi:exopolysaccharide production protein ExoY
LNPEVKPEIIRQIEFSDSSFFQDLVGRWIDVLLSMIGILVLLPIMLIVGALIKFSDGGPMVFKQQRMGFRGDTFSIYKFRTMRVHAEQYLKSNEKLYQRYVLNNYKLPVEEDPRITSLGRFLRRTSLDELPQLFNVLLGDMAMVGPRPVVPEELEEYGDQVDLLLSVKPGVTGYWQICGRSDVNYPERADLEIHYVLNKNFVFDLKILFLTFYIVLRRKGAI